MTFAVVDEQTLVLDRAQGLTQGAPADPRFLAEVGFFDVLTRLERSRDDLIAKTRDAALAKISAIEPAHPPRSWIKVAQDRPDLTGRAAFRRLTSQFA
ncbi:hypothetical protein [Nonomuraea sp. NPDC003201]